MIKKCSTCKIEKSSDSFSRSKAKKDGLQSQCKECRKIYFNEHYRNNKKYYRDKASDRRIRVQKEFIEWLSSKSCMDCGISDVRVLEFDHRGDKEYNVSHLINMGRETAAYKEIEKCDIVCANCHRIRTSKQQNWGKHQYMQAPLT